MNENFATCLNNHVIFKKLSETLSESDKSKCLGLITCRNDILYIWNSLNQCVDSVSIKQILKGADLSEYVSFVPTPSVCFDVEHISVNITSTILALYGAGGVSVIKLPDRWLLKEKRVDITATSLAQRVFLIEHHVLRKVKWHPYSPTDSHLLMLTSDEKLRLYNAVDECLLWECSLSHHTIRRTLPSKLSIGETPVDFDFGLCDVVEDSDDVTYPVFIVWGNGDVYSVETRLEEDYRAKAQGPFRVLPAADDNYGSDASSIIVMETSPPLIVIATSNGLLYHCLLLSDESSRSEAKVLHVIERVELELGLPLGTDIADNDVISCPISLQRDPHLNSRYFCLHNAGIHSVLTPLVSKLNRFNQSSKFSFDKIQSSTEYLLCTAITTGSDISSSPTLGIAFLDLTKILVLLSSGKLLHLPLLNQCDASQFDKIVNDSIVDNVKSEDNFQFLIENLLKSGGISSCPLIKLPGSSTRPQDWLEIVFKATQSYRAILKTHSDVALKIQQKVHQLKSTLNRHMEDLSQLNNEKAGLRSTAEQIAEKYEEINEKQTEIIRRTEQLLLKIECNKDKSFSTKEKKMANILEKAKTKIATLERDINAVQSFYSQLENNSKQPDEKDIHFGNKSQMLFKNLKHLAGEISDLTHRVKIAQETVSTCNFED